MSASVVSEVKVVRSAKSKEGHIYAAVGGKKIRIEGEQHLLAVGSDGSRGYITYKTVEFRRPLVSIAKICERGNRMVFGRGGGYTHHVQSGKRTHFQREISIVVMDMWVDLKALFRRQG